MTTNEGSNGSAEHRFDPNQLLLDLQLLNMVLKNAKIENELVVNWEAVAKDGDYICEHSAKLAFWRLCEKYEVCHPRYLCIKCNIPLYRELLTNCLSISNALV